MSKNKKPSKLPLLATEPIYDPGCIECNCEECKLNGWHHHHHWRVGEERAESQRRKHERITWRDRLGLMFNPWKDVVTWQRTLVSTLAEFICTAIFVFYATASVVSASFGQNVFTFNLIIAFGQGLSLALALFIAAPISGGHLNPAVTISLFLVGRIPFLRGLAYVIAQFAGAIAASAILKAIIRGQFEGSLGATAVSPNISTGGAFVLEMIMTFLLVFVVFGTALDPGSKVGRMAPLAVGLVVLIDVLIGVEWTGASMNPARTLGPQLVSGDWNKYWLYFFAPVCGAIIAAFLYEFYLRIRPYEPPTRSRISGADTANTQNHAPVEPTKVHHYNDHHHDTDHHHHEPIHPPTTILGNPTA